MFFGIDNGNGLDTFLSVEDLLEGGFGLYKYDTSGAVLLGHIEAQRIGSRPYLSAASQVPEPTTLALMGLGLAGVGFSSRRKKKQLAA